MLQTMRSGGTQHPAEIMNFFSSFLVASGGVLDAKNTTNCKVVEDTPSPSMNVLVKIGRAYIPNGDGLQAFPVWIHTDDVEVAIASNGSGNPRKDAIVLYIDKSATPDDEVTNVAKVARVAGTPNASPTAPDDSAISTAIGAPNPFIRLGNVRVDSGATEIEQADIEDTRTDAELSILNMNTRASTREWVPLTDASTIEIDLAKGNKFSVTIGGNRTFTIKNGQANKSFMLRVKQDGTGGRQWTFSFSGYTLKWQDGVTPVPTPTGGKADKLAFEILDDNATIDGTIVSQNH